MKKPFQRLFSGLGIVLLVVLAAAALLFACDLGAKDDEEEETAPSWEGAWFKAWPSDYQYDDDPTHLCRYILAEYSGSTFTLSFYADETNQVFGLRGTFTKTGETSGAITYTASERWSDTSKTWVSYSQTMTLNYSALSAASAVVADSNGANQTYSKVTFSRPASLTGDWGANADFGSGAENTSSRIGADGSYEFYRDGVRNQAGSWWNGTTAAGALFLRTTATEDEGVTGVYYDFITPYTTSGSVMTMDQGDSSPDYVTTKAVVLAGTVDTLAGSITGLNGIVNAVGTAARFTSPNGVCLAGGTLFVVDSENHDIRAIDITTKAVSTIAGTGSGGVLVDADGTSACFDGPTQAVSDGTYLYIADYNHGKVRRMTIASPYSVDSFATDAIVNPTGIALSGNYLYISDYGTGYIYRLEKANTSAAAETFFDTTAVASIRYLAADSEFLYLANEGDNSVIRITIADAAEYEILVSGSGGHTDGYGSGTTGTPTADTHNPYGIAVDSNYLYFTENGLHTIRRMHLGTRYVDTLAGSYGNPGTTDETGTAARFNGPSGLWIAGGTLYIADRDNNSIRAIR